MNRLTIYQDNYADSTVISNRFIDEYMKDANDAQLKIYLYLIRMMSSNLSTSVSDIADTFNHTEKDVMRALKYWEKNKLLSLDYDESKTLTGIHLQDLSKKNQAEIVPLAPVVSIVPKQTAPAAETMSDKPAFEKPSYSPDQLKEFKNREETAQLLFIAESYLCKPLTPSEIKSILFFSDVLHFSDDLIDYLIQYCIDRGKKDFKYIEAVAVNWAQSGVTTAKQAEKFAYKYDKTVYAIMNALGKSGSPTLKELEFIKRWSKEYGFAPDVIFTACERTVLATDKHRFEYTESILANWKKAGVHHKSDIQKLDDQYRRQRETAVPKAASSNKFNQFQQNSYDFDALERDILSN